MNTAEPVILFPHIPKGGGTTFNEIIRMEYTATETLWLKSRDDAIFHGGRFTLDNTSKLKIARGHGIVFGYHRYLEQPFKYLSFVRDPVQRILSNYFYFVSRPDLPEGKKINEEGTSLFDFQAQYPNSQAHYLLGASFPAEYSPCEEDKRQLRAILDEHFLAVGVVEQYNESLFIMRHLLNWKQDYYWRKLNITKKVEARDKVDPEILEKIRLGNQADQWVFEYAKDRIKADLQKLSEQLPGKFEEYVKKRNIYSEFMNARGFPDPLFVHYLLNNNNKNILFISTASQAPKAYSQVVEEINKCAGHSNRSAIFADDSPQRFAVLSQALSSSPDLAQIDLFVIFAASGEDADLKKALLERGVAYDKIHCAARFVQQW